MAKIIDGLVLNGQPYEFTASDANLADIETDATKASKSYNVGEHLTLNGQYYVVIAPIAENDGLVVDTNIRVETVGNEIQVLQNRTSQLTEDLTDNNVSFKFGFDGTNYGYYKDGADTVTPFKSQADIDAAVQQYRCKYLGQFNGAKTIDISGLGATSASQFLIVPVNSDTSGGMESSIYNNMYSYLRRGSVTAFSATSITVSASTIQTRVTGNVDRSIYRNINYQVWYIPAHN